MIGKGAYTIKIRIEKPDNVLQVRKPNERAFEICAEANIVTKRLWS
jgi:predicted N-acetyltransferase YhbS